MRIVDKRGEVNPNQWMKMANAYNGLSWWGHMSAKGECMHNSNILHLIMNFWRLLKELGRIFKSLNNIVSLLTKFGSFFFLWMITCLQKSLA
jgi:hypothetical protein